VPGDAHLFDPGDDFLTLVMTTDTTLSRPLVPAIIQVRQYLKKFEATADIFIEVIDYRALDNICTFPVKFSEHTVIDRDANKQAIGRLITGLGPPRTSGWSFDT
jgi:hypothetical protein